MLSTATKSTKNSLETLKFVNTAFNELRIDKSGLNFPRQVLGFHYSTVTTTPLKNPLLVGLSKEACELLDVDPEIVKNELDILIGNKTPPASHPLAHCYVGHQFGNLAGQLGDGRAISLGDIRNSRGELWDLQYKGAGKTPYSRTADGRAVLRSSIREYLASEHMHHLGVPTTRALSLVVSSDTVDRDIKYNGNVKPEKCAVVIRLSPTFIRFGSFQQGLQRAYNPELGGDRSKFDPTIKWELADYVIKHFYPHIQGLKSEVAYEKLLLEVIERTKETFVKWQLFGFIHGVLNTDNMSILGLTIDYGPYGFMEFFEKWQVINTTDEYGRYAWINQPQIAKWNLNKLYDCFKEIIPKSNQHMIDSKLEYFEQDCQVIFQREMRRKLGLVSTSGSKDPSLVSLLLETMDFCRTDWTNFFLALEKVNNWKGYGEAWVTEEIHPISAPWELWAKSNTSSFNVEALESVLGNPKARASVTAQMGFFPQAYFEEQINRHTNLQDAKAQSRDKWTAEKTAKWLMWVERYKLELKADQETFLHGGRTAQEWEEERQELLRRTNPAFVLRNHVLQWAIKSAESGDFSGVETLAKWATRPFDRSVPAALRKTPDLNTGEICLSCSS